MNNVLSNFYSVNLVPTAVTAAADLFTVTVPAGRLYELHEVRVGQSSDPGDAEAELYVYRIMRLRGTVTPGSGGSTVSPVPLSARQNERTTPTDWTVANTTPATSTIEEICYGGIESNQTSFMYVPHLVAPISAKAGDVLVISLESTPADAISVGGCLTFRDMPLTVGA